MVEQILEVLREQGARKVFANTSDYVNEQCVDVYRGRARAVSGGRL